MSNKENLTPAMVQFFDIKKEYPNSILFFRMGDFYEMFGDDAVEASKILGITLTTRNKNSANQIPLCGVPYHSYEPYLVKLLKAGKNVAICEQLEDAKFAKGVVKRGVTRVVTPATAVEESALSDFDNNFLLSIYIEIDTAYVVAIDVSTGETFLKSTSVFTANDLFAGINIKEVICNNNFDIADQHVQVRQAVKSYKTALTKVLMHYNVTSENVLNIEDKGYIYAISMALDYFDDIILQTKLMHPVLLSNDDSLILDNVAIRTLELVENASDAKSTLFNTMNYTATQMGRRALKNAILRPFRNIATINQRLDMVDYMTKHVDFLNTVKDLMKNVYDIERITARLVSNKATPRDLVSLKQSLNIIPEIKAMLASCGNVFNSFSLSDHEDIYNFIEKTIENDPPATITNGGIIKYGANKLVDELKDIKMHSDELLNQVVEKERQASKIPQLKANYNKVFGFYFEVSKLHSAKVPEHFERKQTLVNAERFTTPELKELEAKILTADERLNSTEHLVFSDVRKYIADQAYNLRLLAKQVAELDVIVSFAQLAIKHNYVRPIVDNSGELHIKNGRHPIVERHKISDFVPNDFNMDLNDERLMLITGPNMSGKSTYLRTSALISIMAHMGSFVPADTATIGLIDRVFTRVGASDNLSKGESTFMVEMIETASILRNATKNSLLILDEIGRGTSTFDGISIAWAVIEYILNSVGAKTLFATHYHELTEIASEGSGATNYTVDVKEWDNEIIFLRKVIKGTADKSYGIYVGRLAGLPDDVSARAEQILSNLEKHEIPDIQLANTNSQPKQRIVQPILVFDNEHPVIEELQKTDVNSLTPIQALQLLHDLKEKSKL